MSTEMKVAVGGPQDGGALPVTPERMVALPTSKEHQYAIYEDTGLRYVYKGIQAAEPVDEEETSS